LSSDSNIASQVDEAIVHSGEAKTEIRPRKADRVYAIKQTYPLYELRVKIRGFGKGLEVAPFFHKECAVPLLFPFLIAEAQIREGQ
jgi:hypothetical protein